MARTPAEAAQYARDVLTEQARARMAEYAAHWTDVPNIEAARHCGVTPRTIKRWRDLLGLPGRPGGRRAAGR